MAELSSLSHKLAMICLKGQWIRQLVHKVTMDISYIMSVTFSHKTSADIRASPELTIKGHRETTICETSR
jgi:hypothetical protein